MKAEILKPLLGAKGTVTAKIVAEPTVNKNGYGIDVTIEIAKQSFIQTLKETGRDYSLICDALGTDPEEWVGHKLTLGIRQGVPKQGPNKGKPTDYVNVLGVA